MFCPICKAEFREGFTKCSDCHTSLVTSEAEARRTPVVRVWKGEGHEKLESVLSALQEKNIPLQFKERVKVRPVFQITILGFGLFPRQSSLKDEFEVFVLESDRKEASEAINNLV